MAGHHSHLLISRLQQLLVLQCLLPFFVFLILQPCTVMNLNESFLELSRGLNLSILASYNASDGSPLQISTSDRRLNNMFTAGMASLDYQGFFFPILRSPASFFNSSNHSTISFSLGFYLDWPIEDVSQQPYDMYLAVCAVTLSPNYTSPSPYAYTSLYSSYYGRNIHPNQIDDAFVVPVWIANLDRPIRDWQKASLGVVQPDASGADSSIRTASNILQLKEGYEVVWSVSNVGMIEMRDSGDLLIFSDSTISNSPNFSTNQVVWQISTNVTRLDTLVQGQKLRVGGELRSSDSNYLARMEKGGLVLYLNNGAHLDGNIDNYVQQGLQQPPPYWIFPMIDPSAPVNASINQLISTAPCNNSTAFTVLDLLDEGLAPTVNLDPGSCNLFNTSIFKPFDAQNANMSWGYLKLQNDGRLYIYSVQNRAGLRGPPFVTSIAVDSSQAVQIWSNSSYSRSSFPHWGPECDVPMACGPGGVCTPDAKTLCSCPVSYFEPRNNSDFSQGCKRQTSLPVCTTGIEHINSTDFLELNSTASIFLFNGWNFNPTHAPLAQCKSLCSSTCSCNGFFYQVIAGHNSACFFITDHEFTLLKVVDKTLSFLNYTSQSPVFPTVQKRSVIARNYATFLKVVPIDSTGSSSPTAPDNKSAAATIALIVILPTIVIGIACTAIYRLSQARKRKFAQIRLQAEDEKELQDILPLLPSRFSYKDLHEATKGFSILLGAGGCGSVYSGILWDGRKVAVKVLTVVLQGAEQSRQFLAEVSTIGRTGHHNIVRLYGFCWELSHRLLVYEYVERGSLDHWLFNVDDPEAFLDWRTRYNVALGIGCGVHYLHEECEPPILHFDIKPQNILLAEDFVAKLADFGMSRLIPRDASSVVTGVRGTPGYIAPEWLSHGKVSKKSDIFSMGMVLLELVGGRKIWDFSLLNSSLDPIQQEAWHFPSWGASKCKQGLMMDLVDKRLHLCGFDGEQAHRHEQIPLPISQN